MPMQRNMPAFQSSAAALRHRTRDKIVTSNRANFSNTRPFSILTAHPLGGESNKMKNQAGDSGVARRYLVPARLRSGAASPKLVSPRATLKAVHCYYGGRFLKLGQHGVKFQLIGSAGDHRPVTLIVEGGGEFSGVVTWRRNDRIGVRILKQRDERSSVRRSVAGESSAAFVPPREPPSAAPVRPRQDRNLLDIVDSDRSSVTLQPGQVLFAEGDTGTCMYVVKTGVVRIRSGATIYEDVGPAGIVGEMALIEKHMPRSATVYALVATEVIAIEEPRFLALLEQEPNFGLIVMRVLSRRLRYMDAIGA